MVASTEVASAETAESAEEEYIKSLRYNVNVFLPHARSIGAMDEQSHEQLRRDEEEARGLARHLWDAAMPDLTGEIRSSGGSGLQLPVDGRSLTELIHRRGVNCRYLGRLADLTREEEVRDALASPDGGDGTLAGKGRAPRFRMPLCWLELLECEMVARAAKHVLDSYMTGRGGGGSSTASMGDQVPAQTIASFLAPSCRRGRRARRRRSGGRAGRAVAIHAWCSTRRT